MFIAGINGFIGRALCVWLESRGVSVSGVDKQVSTQTPRRQSLDLQDVDSVALALTAYAPQVIFHAAGAVGATDALLLYQAHLVTTEVLLRAAKAASPQARIIVIGSAAEYGNQARVARNIEEGAPAQPDSDYGRSKLAQSNLARDLGMALSLDVIRVRLFNTLGPGQGTQLVAGAMVRRLRQALLNHDCFLDVYDPDSERDFLDVRDIARLLWMVAVYTKPDPARPPIHIASGQATSVKDLAAILINSAGVVEHINLRPIPRGRPTACIGEPTTLQLLASNVPVQTISLSESLYDMWQWELQQNARESAI